MKFLMIILLNIIKVYAYWKPVFSDEFNSNDSLDYNKWMVENELESCKGNLVQQLNCNTNNTRNVRLVDGALALTAIREPYLEKEYTASIINSKDSFTFGKFEIRAALPGAKMLRPIVSLKPTSRSPKWPDDGEIVILTNRRKNILEFGIYFTARGQPKYVGEKFSIATDLKNFHTYILEWTERELSFKFDGIRLAIIDFFKEIKDSYNPFLKPFTLSIGLGVGGVVFQNQDLTEEDVNEWNCSSLLVDYVRIDRWVNGNDRSGKKDLPIIDTNRKSSSDICNVIMQDLKMNHSEKASELVSESSNELPSTTTSTQTSNSPLIDSSSISALSSDLTQNSTSFSVLSEEHIEEFLSNNYPAINSNIKVVISMLLTFNMFL